MGEGGGAARDLHHLLLESSQSPKSTAAPSSGGKGDEGKIVVDQVRADARRTCPQALGEAGVSYFTLWPQVPT